MDAFEKHLSQLHLRQPSASFGRRETFAKYARSPAATGSRSRSVGRIFGRLTQAKAAAVLGLACTLAATLIVTSLFSGGSPALAQTLEKLRSAKTMAFTLVVREGNNGKVLSKSRMYCMSPGKFRIEYADLNQGDSVMICDQTAGKIMLVDQTRKTAELIAVNRPDDKRQTRRDPAIRMIEDMQALAGHATKQLGSAKLNGHPVKVMAIEEEDKRTKIWADEQTGNPLKIEVLEKSDAGKLSTQVLTDIQLDISMEEELFRLAPPAGYAISNPEPAPEETTRAHQVAGFLKIYTKYMGGKLPPVLAEAGPNLNKRLQSGKGQQPPIAEMMKLAFYGAGVHAVGRGVAGQEWQYYPKAQLGDPKAIVFWSLDNKTGVYWSVYGDMRVEEVDQDKLLPPQ